MAAPPNYKLVFADDFDRLSIADTRTATANWYTAQAWGGGFGDAAFMPSGSARSPFSIVNKAGESALQIHLTRNASGKLESGLISNTFPDGTSKAPQDGNPYGYYETRLWLPDGKGIWPGFWAIEKERLSPARDHVFEIDVLEQHGSAGSDRYGTNLHDWDWNGTKLTGHSSQPHQNVVGNNVLTTGWHTYGVEIRPDVMTFYMDDHAYYSLKTPATLNTDPMFMINLAAGGGWPIDPKLVDAKMYVDYFHAYELSGTSNHPAPEPVQPPTPVQQPSTPIPTPPPTKTVPASQLNGTAGNDTFYVNTSATTIHESADSGYDTVRSTVSYVLPTNVEKLVLAEGGNFAGTGNNGNNQIYGNASSNYLSGGAGADHLYGQGGNDQLYGGDGNDRLYGGIGDDVLVGGTGADRMEGGAGRDTFVFNTVSDSAPKLGQDSIVDFAGASGDRVDLRQIDANVLVQGNQSFEWIGSHSFTKAAQLRFEKGVLSGDIDGDHHADFAVSLGSVHMVKDYLLL